MYSEKYYIKKYQKRRIMKKHNYRFIVSMFLLFILIVLMINLLLPTKIDAKEPITILKVNIVEGDSLWKIAERYDNNNIDLRRYIDIIQDYNQMTSTVLQPGQNIYVPIFNEY